jgi:molecular chaperone HtpG
MTGKIETFEFQSEARQVLDLMVHSVYSKKDIFLRELISNASDAIDKLKFEALQNSDLTQYTGDAHIRIQSDKEARTIQVIDNGIGMTRDEVIEYIGTIAKSGTGEFLKQLQKAKSEELPPEMIGQFGVGFYASFMVADKVELLTRSAREETATKWLSGGDGGYTLEEAERDAPGTTVTLHLHSADEDDGLADYTNEYTINNIVKKYSDFVSYPIKMLKPPAPPAEGEEEKPAEEPEDETLNSMKAIWTRSESDVEEAEYTEFYKHISHDWNEPLLHINYRAEGAQEFRALLFIPSAAPFDMFTRDSEHGVQLYIRRIFIMQDCKELIPPYMRFVRGVVDSEDLNLNVSREILQKGRMIQVISKALTRKIFDTLASLLENDRDKYNTFWQHFGRILREGLFQDQKNQERLLQLCLFSSTASEDELVTLKQYVENMPEDQEAIYYMTGESRAAVEKSPHLEVFKDKGYEVLLLTDPVDEVWVSSVFECEGKPLRSIGKGEIELGSDDEKKQAEEERKEKETQFKTLLESLKSALDEHVKEVRLSSRLKESPACLVGDQNDITPQLEQLLKASGQEVPEVKRILEVNPDHEIFKSLQEILDKDSKDPRLNDYSQLLYGQALLAEGGQLPDPAAFSKLVADLMAKSMAGGAGSAR